ncbi:GPW/gp25 family protein [Cupriavidus sp. UGS-1]|uniref:GPW/gp25 family protein n=1 Tax=Cupriavidus sp. UGS-1 TaxID=2899826 RepID=UPI001E4ABBBB|nr:GPW/gp25 family protein [Cupriavidus sp. UGS-1]MCD9124035.1 GPW/gp25 family protein [Cupriavidus sp. UGS-1]
MIGMNAITGRAVSGLAHLYQSIAKILTTPLGSRLARRNFGAELFELIDAPLNSVTIPRLYSAAATALMRWEPRLRLTRVRLSLDDLSGAPVLDIEGYTTETGERVDTRVVLARRSAQ